MTEKTSIYSIYSPRAGTVDECGGRPCKYCRVWYSYDRIDSHEKVHENGIYTKSIKHE